MAFIVVGMSVDAAVAVTAASVARMKVGSDRRRDIAMVNGLLERGSSLLRFAKAPSPAGPPLVEFPPRGTLVPAKIGLFSKDFGPDRPSLYNQRPTHTMPA